MRRLHLGLALCAGLTAASACKNKDETPADQAAEQKSAEEEAKAEAPPPPAEEEATCETAAKNLMALMKPELEKQLGELPEEQRAMAEQQMKAEFKLEVIQKQCEEQKPGPEELACVTKAKTTEELQKCRVPPPAPPGGAPPGAGAPHPGGAPPPGSAPPSPPAEGEEPAP